MRRGCVKWLQGQLPELVSRGVLSGEAAERIRQHYGEAAEQSGRRIALTVCSILGAALIGAGIILVLAHNWEDMPRAIRTAIALAPLAVAQALALWILTTGRTSSAWREGIATFLTLAIGASIALVAQTYNIPGDGGTFTLTWMLLALPIAYVLDVTVPALVYLVGITVWAGAESVRGAQLLLFWPLVALALPHLRLAIRENQFSPRSSLLGWTLSICLLVAVGLTLSDLLEDLWILIYSSATALLFMVGYLRFREAPTVWQNPFLAVGGVAVPVTALLLSCNFPWDHLGHHYWTLREHPTATLWAGAAVVALLVLAAVILLVAVLRRRQRTPILFAMLPAMAVAGYGLHYLTGAELPAQLLFNVYLFALGLSTLVAGVSDNRIGAVNAGMLIISALLVARFFDSDLGFLARGVAFIAIGVGFLVTNVVLVRRSKGGAQ